MLETLIRLSTAHAKARLSKTVDLQDAELAIELVQYATFKKVLEKSKKSKRGRDDESGEDSDDEDMVDDEAEEQVSKRPRKQPGDEGYDPFEFEDQPVSPKKKLQKKKPAETEEADDTMDITTTPLTQERLSTFKSSLTKLFRDERAQSIPMSRVRSFIKAEHKTQPFSQEDIDSALNTMMEDNKVMVAEDVLFLI